MSHQLVVPDSVVKLLKSTRFVHLATSLNDFPHVSLMNYTYYSNNSDYYIIITTPKGTTKYENIVSNPNVSLLVHDWISAKTTESEPELNGNSGRRRNSLYELLTNLNKTEISSVSVMINGKAKVVDPKEDTESFNFYKSLHKNNELIDEQQSKNYIESDDCALVLIKIENIKVTDTNDNVQSY